MSSFLFLFWIVMACSAGLLKFILPACLRTLWSTDQCEDVNKHSWILCHCDLQLIQLNYLWSACSLLTLVKLVYNLFSASSAKFSETCT